jgi:hypothetical protein
MSKIFMKKICGNPNGILMSFVNIFSYRTIHHIHNKYGAGYIECT